MKSAVPKVLHPILNRPMVQWVVDAARQTGAEAIVLVVGHGADAGARSVSQGSLMSPSPCRRNNSGPVMRFERA